MAGLIAQNRSRSPRYPSSSLSDCLNYINQIYDAVHRSPIDSETAYKLMGFSGKSGSSSRALGSVRQFGLIDGVSENTRISDLALAILEPESQDEYLDRLSEALVTPDVFSAILSKFSDRMPQADEPIRAFLIREMGFQKNSADECIKCMRDSYAFLESHLPRTHKQSGEPFERVVTDKVALEEQGKSKSQTTFSSVDVVASSNFAAFPLSKECQAELRIIGPLTPKAVSNLLRHVQLMAEVWQEEE